MPLNVLGFRVDSRSGEVLRDCFGRPVSLDPELAAIIASDGRQIQAFQRCRLVCSRVADLKPGPWSKQPSAQHTAGRYTTAGYCDSVTIFQLCSVSTVDDASTSDSLPKSDVFPPCVWRATSESSSDGYQASSREHDSACDATKSLVDHLGSHDGQTFPGVSRVAQS